MKKILAILLALAMLLSFAACGGNGDEETTTTTTEETTIAEETTTTAAEETTIAEETTAADATTVAGETTTAAEETTVADAEMSKADFVKFLNAETAKAAKGSYKFNRNCEYTDPIDVGSATSILNGIISAIDENENLDTVVGGFLGIGTKKGSYPKDELDSDYALKATSLNESDLGSFSYADGVYSFTLANATNPKKTGATPVSRFTNDFITHEEVVDGIADFTTAITVNDTNVNYTNIKVSVKVAGGKITEIKYSYAFDATLALKAVVTINGSGAAKTTATYSDIKY